LTHPTDFVLGKVSVEYVREPEQEWRRFTSPMAKALECGSVGPGPELAPDALRVGIIPLFEAAKGAPFFAEAGVYRLRAVLPFNGLGLVRTPEVRIEVADIPANERRLIEAQRAVIWSCLEADFNGPAGDPDRVRNVAE